jgi:hypothetical protein
MQLIAALLENQFGPAEVDLKEGTVVTKVGAGLLGIKEDTNVYCNTNYSNVVSTFPVRGL